MNIAAVVLAAGASRRLGRPKQNVVLGGETLLQRTVKLAADAGFAPIIVVVGEGAQYAENLTSPGVVIAVNRDSDEGIASSIRCGIALASHRSIAGAVILACDQPALKSDHLHALTEDQHRLTGSAYGGATGVPAYFPVEFFPSLLQMRGDTGARSLLKTAHAIKAEELKLDIDTEQDLDLARALLESPATGSRSEVTKP